jgi:RNA-directed DNA polymerase
LLKLIRAFLNAGVMKDGLVSPTKEGTPQGGPLSPLLSNIMLDDLDKELERRGLCFCRYADDCNIYVGSRKAGERVKRSITQFITDKLRLKVNEDKSAVAKPSMRKFLGYTIAKQKDTVMIKPAIESVRRFKLKVKALLRKGRGWNFRFTIKRLSRTLRGWVNYFKLSTVKKIFEDLDGWIRRRLRCVLWRQWKRPRTRYRMLRKLGLDDDRARASAGNGRGPWWNSGSSHMNRAIPVSIFRKLGLLSLSSTIYSFQNSSRNAVYGTVRTVV